MLAYMHAPTPCMYPGAFTPCMHLIFAVCIYSMRAFNMFGVACVDFAIHDWSQGCCAMTRCQHLDPPSGADGILLFHDMLLDCIAHKLALHRDLRTRNDMSCPLSRRNAHFKSPHTKQHATHAALEDTCRCIKALLQSKQSAWHIKCHKSTTPCLPAQAAVQDENIQLPKMTK